MQDVFSPHVLTRQLHARIKATPNLIACVTVGQATQHPLVSFAKKFFEFNFIEVSSLSIVKFYKNKYFLRIGTVVIVYGIKQTTIHVYL